MGVRVAALLLSFLVWTHPQYRQALELYDAGMYERAMELFADLPDNALTDGYDGIANVLCGRLRCFG